MTHSTSETKRNHSASRVSAQNLFKTILINRSVYHQYSNCSPRCQHSRTNEWDDSCRREDEDCEDQARRISLWFYRAVGGRSSIEQPCYYSRRMPTVALATNQAENCHYDYQSKELIRSTMLELRPPFNNSGLDYQTRSVAPFSYIYCAPTIVESPHFFIAPPDRTSCTTHSNFNLGVGLFFYDYRNV